MEATRDLDGTIRGHLRTRRPENGLKSTVTTPDGRKQGQAKV